MAKKKSEAEVEASLSRAKAKLAKIEDKNERAVGAVVKKGAMTVTSIMLGAFESKMPQTVAKIPPKVWLGTIGWGLAAATQRWHWLSSIFEGFGDANFAAYDYHSAVKVATGQPLPFIAGEEELVEET